MSKKNIRLFLLMLFIMFLIALVAQQSVEKQYATILIISKDQSDTASLNPTRINVAAELALTEYNKKANNNNTYKKIKHEYIFYSGDEQEGYMLADDYLDTNSNVVGLVGDFNTPGTTLVVELAKKYEIPHFSFFATDQSIFTEDGWSFFYRSSINEEQNVMLNLLSSVSSGNRLAVFSSELRNISSRWEQLEPLLIEKGYDIYFKNSYANEVIDFREDLLKLHNNKDDFDAFLIFLGSTQIEHFLQQLEIYNFDKEVFSTGVTISVEGIQEIKSLSTQMYTIVPQLFINVQTEKDYELNDFVKRYRVAIGYHRFDSLGPTIYDGFNLLYQAINSSSSSEEVRDYLRNYSNNRMIGRVEFDNYNTLQEKLLIPVRVYEGQFIEVSYHD